jgi:ATP/ADP translocase
MYSVRELFAAELLFGLFIGAFLLVGLVFYLMRQAGELSLAWARPAVRALAQTVRWSESHSN